MLVPDEPIEPEIQDFLSDTQIKESSTKAKACQDSSSCKLEIDEPTEPTELEPEPPCEGND